MKVRQLYSSHIDFIYDNECLEFPLHIQESKEDIEKDVKCGCYYGLYKNVNLLGYCCIHETREEIYLNNLVVLKEYRGLKHSEIIIQYIKYYSYLLKIKRIWLHVSVINDPAIGLYNKCGFKIKESVKDFYAENEDSLVMEYIN